MTGPLLTAPARRHILKLHRAIRSEADRLDRRLSDRLRARGYEQAAIRAFLAITPAAASRLRRLNLFLEHVDYHGRRLAKLDVEPAEVQEVLHEAGVILDGVLGKQFQPAREQLALATTMALQEAYYKVREAETQALFGLERAETKATGLEDLLRRFVGILARAFQARSGRLLLLDRPVAGPASRPLYIPKGSPEEQLIRDSRMRGRYASYWSFPLAGRCAGLLQFGFAAPYPWLPREFTLLRAVAERCCEAVEKARLREENGRLQAEARGAEEEERRRIARELHDEAGQSLLALRLQLEMLERTASGALRTRLASARKITEGTVEEIRRIVAALSPTFLEQLGLESAIRRLVTRFRKTHPVNCRTQISGGSHDIPQQTSQVIYRVVQESLQNIAKHAQATHVNLSLRKADKRIRLSVVDNGAGFNMEAVSTRPVTFGLAGMRERAVLLGGTLAVHSSPGRGTRILLELPIPATVLHHGKDSRSHH